MLGGKQTNKKQQKGKKTTKKGILVVRKGD